MVVQRRDGQQACIVLQRLSCREASGSLLPLADRLGTTQSRMLVLADGVLGWCKHSRIQYDTVCVVCVSPAAGRGVSSAWWRPGALGAV